ncbi:DISARM system phospholipase D-like protein DrmC [Paraburkholderia adhaesiva]|uniref:DISARM system phospholipase D-like protein DrmC n=1 Tax=Paraburkholderia adhaesiva TaxID=2883244 RepID=UPI001F45623B|nr:DISARM system phospholipase D-like protein DrmC [Paraburkholderia adhaesiva]
MEILLDAVTTIARLISPEKVRFLAGRVRRTESGKANIALLGVVDKPEAKDAVDKLVDAWRATSVSAPELASMLIAASHAVASASNIQTTELVWTGPTTPFVSTRRTEQALLQVIAAARQSLFITSFVAYDVSTIVKALNDASKRGVRISMLLESSQNHGGSISFDAIGKMKTLMPSARLFSWHERTASFSDGRVHAKVAVADGSMCFVTSANLTGHAMEQNMEAGVLISGGDIPKLLHEHLDALVNTKIVSLIEDSASSGP